MIKFIKNYLRVRKAKKLLIISELDRLKENFVYRYLLNNYEIALKGKVDFGAWFYATRDVEQIKADGKLNEAYDYARKIMQSQFKQEDKAPC